MHILFFVNCFGAGGKERRLLELIKGACKYNGIKCSLVIMDRNVHYKEIFDLGIDIHFLIRKSKNDPSIFAKFYRLCKQVHPDIIHSFDSMTMTYIMPVATLMNVKVVNGMICDAPAKIDRFSKNGILSLVTFPYSDTIVANSYAGLKSYKAPAGKSICIHNGFDFKRLNSVRPADDVRQEFNIKTRYVVGMVATFSHAKDHASFFKAAGQVLKIRNDVSFVTVGDGVLREQYQQQYAGEPNIIFLGKQSDVESIINIFDISVLATYTEGISNAIMEYMALGKPVIATDGGGTSELIIDDETGFLVEACNAQQIAGKILYLIEKPEKMARMGENGRQRIDDHFSIKSMVASYIDLYRRLKPGLVEQTAN
jgi:glycosyltransferase involved in cell wall biosynthesis